MNRRTWLVVFCFALLTSCGGKPNDKADDEIRLSRGLTATPDTLDPHKNLSVDGHPVMYDLYEGLLRYSADGVLEGAVAEDWRVSGDGLHYHFTFRDKLVWSNGDPLTANDFVFSFRRLVDPNTAASYAGFLTSIVNADEIIRGEKNPDSLGVRAIDSRTLEIDLVESTPYFPQLLTHPATAPLHQASLKEHGDQFTKPGLLVSNGAYTLKDSVFGSVISLTRNPNYRDKGSVSIDAVDYHIVVNDEAMYNRYRAGELHITASVPSGSFLSIREERPNELKVAPQLGLFYFGFNMTTPKFGDAKQLRRALSMAIDREALVEKVTGRGEMPAYSWVPPGIDGYEPAVFDFQLMTKEQRIEEARRLYLEAGFSDANPAKFELRYNVGDAQQKLALAVQAMWREILGAQAELINEEFQVLLSNITQKRITEVFRLNWTGDYFDPYTFLQLMESSNPSNMTGYSNPAFDQLMVDAASEVDQVKRMAIFREAEALMLSENPAIPLYFPVSKHLVKPEVRGWTNTVVDFHPTQFLSLATD